MSVDNNPVQSKAMQRYTTISTLVILGLLLATLIFNTGSMIHGQLLRLGEQFFGAPAENIQYSFLRGGETAELGCDPNPNIDALVAAEMAKPLDEIELLLGNSAKDPVVVRQSIESAAAVCQEKAAFMKNVQKHLTPAVKVFRTVEKSFYGLFHYGQKRVDILLMLMLAVAAITTTVGMHHIGIRPAHSRKDYVVYSSSMILACVLVLVSYASYINLQLGSGVPIEKKAWAIHLLWIGAFVGMLLVSVYKFIKPPVSTEEGNYGKAFLAIPLFASMAIISTLVYLFVQNYAAATAVYLGVMPGQAGLFISLALFIWAGMLLKQTNVVDAFVNVIRPLHLAPETVTWVLMIGAGFATAFTGASGVFVIAAGAIIYREVLHAGGRRQYAVATTAMSGSLGVVLSPCLLIVLIAALNKEVTTDLLFAKGIWVFILTTTVFYILSLLLAQDKFRLAPLNKALPAVLNNLKFVLPYVVIFVIGYYAYYLLLDTKLDEFSAPVIMPVVILGVLAWDQYLKASGKTISPKALAYTSEHAVKPKGVMKSLFEATSETQSHIGALILLMALSIGVGGLIERSELMPQVVEYLNLESTLAMITLTVVMMVIVGMLMDPFGAAILVSGTVAPVAYKMGVDPVHFWMIVLTAFELGYLSPPVALNQLLARQVVGEEEILKGELETKGRGFYWRYERWLLPVIVMGFCLLLVAYVPYYFGVFDYYPSKF